MKKVHANAKKIIFNILNLSLVFILTAYTLIFAVKATSQFDINNSNPAENKIYTIWHIETFEGGSKSRINFLKGVARELEKLNPGILFNIQMVEAEKLEDYLAETEPDIFSFGFGVGRLILNTLTNFDDCYAVRTSLVNSGKYNEKIYALPYIVSGYALFSHGGTENCIEYGNSGYLQPEKAILNATKPLTHFGTQFETYKNFVYHHDHALIGTARDVFRISNLNKIGRTNASIIPLDNYTDLLQYIACTKKDEIINEFCKMLFSQPFQSKLTEYNLFSCLDTKLYTQGIYNDMENAIFNCQIANVFEKQ